MSQLRVKKGVSGCNRRAGLMVRGGAPPYWRHFSKSVQTRLQLSSSGAVKIIRTKKVNDDDYVVHK